MCNWIQLTASEIFFRILFHQPLGLLHLVSTWLQLITNSKLIKPAVFLTTKESTIERKLTHILTKAFGKLVKLWMNSWILFEYKSLNGRYNRHMCKANIARLSRTKIGPCLKHEIEIKWWNGTTVKSHCVICVSIMVNPSLSIIESYNQCQVSDLG